MPLRLCLVSLFAVLALLTGAAPSHAADGCPSASTTLTSSPTVITDTTVGMRDDFASSWGCGDHAPSRSPDVAYAFTLPSAGVMDLRVDPLSSGFAPSLYVRPSCSSEAYCLDPSSDGSVHLRSDMPAGTYDVIVDTRDGSTGAFQLTARAVPATCGDGIVSAGEACDPGPAATGDGCVDPGIANQCTPEPPTSGADSCPGQTVTLAAGTTILSGTTIGYTDSGTGSCGYPFGGRDRVYRIVPSVSGTITARVGLGADGVTDVCSSDLWGPECWYRVLYVRSSCSSTSSEPAHGCADVGGPTVEGVTWAAVAGVPMFLYVDGYDDGLRLGQGPYHLRLDLQ